MDRLKLTDNEKKVLGFIEAYMEKNSIVPTYEEIQNRFQYRSKSSVQQYVKQLTQKGFLENRQVKGRNLPIQLVKESEDMMKIPLEGKVAAGLLTEAVQNREYIDIPRNLLKPGGDYFALTVKGDSMIEDCIMDGDIVVIRRQHTARNGQTVVALVNDDATIKRYYSRQERVELHPANPNYEVIHIPRSSNFKILGVLSSVIRKME